MPDSSSSPVRSTVQAWAVLMPGRQPKRQSCERQPGWIDVQQASCPLHEI